MLIPHLASTPTLDLEKRILAAKPTIEHWLRKQWQHHTVPFYCSVDLRNSGFKLAPVDTNLFPGGFNNLNPDFVPLCIQAMMIAVEKICPDAHSVLLIPENHTRNIFYLQNVAALQSIMQQAGMNVRIGSLLPDITQPTTIPLPNGESLLLEPLQRKENKLFVQDFDPCAILLNNDLSGGIPEILKNLDQTIIPPLRAGWATRRKSWHFSAYDSVAQDFAELIDIDPWLINPYFTSCGKVNFQEKEGLDCVAAAVDEILSQIKEKYVQFGIKEKPFVIVKADSGTYGMGIMSVRDGTEVYALNRKQRNKMTTIKEGTVVKNVLVQEGVHTLESIHQAVAEPVIYMIDHLVVGGFYRVHMNRGVDENLNVPGMHFVPLAFDATCMQTNPAARPDAIPNRFYIYGVIARLALLASAIELERYTQAPSLALVETQ
jgi:glutamate--cysteine ligase